MKFWFNKIFGLTKQEFNGVLFLIIIIIAIKLVPVVYQKIFINSPRNELVVEGTQKVILADAEQKFAFTTTDNISKKPYKKTYFNFDPNSIGLDEWQELGLSAKQAQTILNYINKGGKFYKPEDLKKMYVISEELFEDWAPFIKINAVNSTKSKPLEFTSTFEKKNIKSIIIDVNKADTIELQKINGVGRVFANRIFRYRQNLGGFYDKEQLKEVYGVDSVLYKLIASQISIDASTIQKININTVEFNELKKFPYLNFKQINAIINYRKQHGPYKNVEDLKKIILLKDYNFDKIINYLNF